MPDKGSSTLHLRVTLPGSNYVTEENGRVPKYAPTGELYSLVEVMNRKNPDILLRARTYGSSATIRGGKTPTESRQACERVIQDHAFKDYLSRYGITAIAETVHQYYHGVSGAKLVIQVRLTFPEKPAATAVGR